MANDGRDALQSPFNDAEKCAFGQDQNQFDAKDISGGQRAGPSDAAESTLLVSIELDAVAGHSLLGSNYNQKC